MIPEDELIMILDQQPDHIQKMLIRRSLRMILGTEVDQGDELMFNNWRREHGLHPLDQNNNKFPEPEEASKE